MPSASGQFIALAGIGQLDLLPRLFGKVLVRAAVVREVTQAGAGRVSSTEIASVAWLEQWPVDPPPARLLAEELGAGEAEAITLALRISTREVLLDARRARRIAEMAYHLPVRGTAGLSVAAKRINLLPSVPPLLKAMRGNGYYLSQRLVDLGVCGSRGVAGARQQCESVLRTPGRATQTIRHCWQRAPAMV